MFRFTIRDLLWLTALVATSCAVYFHMRSANERYAKVAPIIDKFDLTTLAEFVSENGGADNLHYFDINYGGYYGSKAEMRFINGETLPAIKKFEMHNPYIVNGPGPKSQTWSKKNF